MAGWGVKTSTTEYNSVASFSLSRRCYTLVQGGWVGGGAPSSIFGHAWKTIGQPAATACNAKSGWGVGVRLSYNLVNVSHSFHAIWRPLWRLNLIPSRLHWSQVTNYRIIVSKSRRQPPVTSARQPSLMLKPGPHQQQCRSNVRLCCQKRQQCRTSFALKFRPFDKVERCFNIVAQNGNIVEATGNKVACCFDIVASVDRALFIRLILHQLTSRY